MASSQNMFNHNGPIPRPNTQYLVECLKDGQLDLPTAIGQLSLFLRESLKAIEDFAAEQSRMNMERKLKTDKMDKLINDLSEKCQGMQQALLYKEEKYDEKCREAERYKVICELKSNAAVEDNSFYTPVGDLNNNNISGGYEGNCDGREQKESVVKIEAEGPKRHVKLSQNQMHMRDFVKSPYRNPYEDIERDNHNDDSRSIISQYYAGGPCRRKIPLADRSKNEIGFESRTSERLENIGGVNVRGPSTINNGPVAADRLAQRPIGSSYDGETNKRVRVDLTSQRNEMMSSSGNIALQTRQKYVEKDLHKQVAGGCWNRLASRRKKDWPF